MMEEEEKKRKIPVLNVMILMLLSWGKNSSGFLMEWLLAKSYLGKRPRQLAEMIE